MTDLAPSPPSAEAPEQKRHLSELWVCALLLAVGVIVLIAGLSLTGKFSSTDPIGPRAVPWLVAGGLFLTALLLAIDVLRGGHGHAEEGEDVDLDAPADWKTVGLLIAVFVANIALVDLLGWVISGAMLFFGSAWVLGSRHVIRNLVISFTLSLATFYGFWVGLGIHLPPGILDGVL